MDYKPVIAISRCKKISRDAKKKTYFEFHFKGAYAGEIVKTLHVYSKNKNFIIGEDYILHLLVTEIELTTLKCKLLRCKKVHWDKLKWN